MERKGGDGRPLVAKLGPSLVAMLPAALISSIRAVLPFTGQRR